MTTTDTNFFQIVTNKKRSPARKRNRNRRPRKNSSGDLSIESDSSGSSSGRSSASSCSLKSKNENRKGHPEISLEEKSRYVALDCEMVGVGENGVQSAVARVTIVDWDGNIVLDRYVKPDREITDYRTFVSGITANDYTHHNAIDLESCRKLVLDHLEGKILVGHALKNDLHALGISHDWQATRDTAKYEPFMKTRFDDSVLWPRRLRDLACEKLSREIQVTGAPHSPYEDAVAAMDLYKIARNKWEKVMDYKIKKTAEIQQQRQVLFVASAAA
jgi:RNA exonuclease 4